MKAAKVALASLFALSLLGCASDGATPSEPENCEIVGVAPADCAGAQALLLPEQLPPARGNQYADREEAATLGFHLFFEARLGHGASCPTCHLPELAFTDRVPVSTGTAVGTRNSPTTFNAGWLSVFFWDGKADSLWSQPLFAIENPLEMDSSRLELAHLIAGDVALSAEYRTVFGSLPDVAAWPLEGKPGDAAFDDLPDATKRDVNRIAANVGKAMEAYMRKNITSRSAFDRFLLGDDTDFGPVPQRGLALFFEQGCHTCHSGPMLTDERFHDVGFPSLEGAAPDRGRAEGLAVLLSNPFNLGGEFADPGPGVPAMPKADGSDQEYAFRTPSLRNVGRTGPYGHDGALTTLREVLAVHAPDLDTEQTGNLIAFLQSLNGDYPLPPWNKWPSPL